MTDRSSDPMVPERCCRLHGSGRSLRPWWALPLLTVLFASCGSRTSAPPSERLLLVTIDTLRYDRFAGPRAVMPRLAAAAAQGLSFSHCYASTPLTQPTHATLLTGLQPWEHGVTRNGQVLDERWTTLAERLSAAGFTTAAVVASFPLEHRFGFAQGFDIYRDQFSESRLKKTVRWDGIEPDWKHFYSLADEIVGSAIEVLDEMPAGRQFLWVHFYDPHSPYGDSWKGAKPTVTTKQLGYAAQDEDRTLLGKVLPIAAMRYDDDVAAVDRALGRLLERLAADDISTTVVVTADHGESFGEDGSFGHGDRVTPPQLRVPLVLLSADIEPGRRREVCSTLDVHRTLLSLAGLSVAATAAVEGRDLLQPPPENPIAVGMRRTSARETEEVRADGSTVLLTGNRFYWARGRQLLAGDAEAVDGSDDPQLRQAAARAFAAFERSLAAGSTVDLQDDETRAALRELGYVR